ncbi:MAG TPA: BatA and WFA domain-containing protein [Tepidisphaeraceae bacterium]|jgi:hypothetical protein|nr:BatA and WFA domain-containing protein [Tepidisphaeraceae bacterium]
MHWFPRFDNWKAGLFAAMLVIPALLVLYFLKLRRKEMAVSSTFLWKKAIQDLQVNAPFQRLRRNLLLLLQLLLLIALLLSLARPIANYRPGAGKMTVILIDRSASMSAKDIDGHSRLDEAKKRAKDLIDSMPRHATAMVIAFDDAAETLQPLTTDTAALRNAVDRISPTDRKSRLKLAYQLAEAQTNFNPEQLRSDSNLPDVRLYSDGKVLDADELAVRGNLVFEKIGNPASKNVAIVALNAKRNYERPTEVQVFARLANYGPDPVEVPVQLSVDGDVVDVAGSKTRTTYLLPENWSKETRKEYDDKGGRAQEDSVEFKLDLTTAAVVKVEQMLKDGDVLAADDVAQVVVPPPKSLAVLLVTDGNYFLEKAVNSLSLKNPDTMRPTAYDGPEVPTKYDVIIFDRYKPKKLPPAGSFVYFLDGRRPDLPDMRLKIGKDPAGKPVMLEDVGVLDWKRDHPILKDLAMSKLYVAEAAKLDVPQEDVVLLDGLKGPLIVFDRTGKYTNLVVAFDVLQSNWPLKVSFPIFLHNALQYLAIGSDMDVRPSKEPGATPTIPRANLQKIGDVKQIKLKGPADTKTIKVPDTGDFVLPSLDHVGLYTTDPPVPQFEQMAVNLLDANESNLVPAEKAPGDINAVTVTAQNAPARLELWWWIVAVAALPLLMIEWWVYTRRVHL